MGRTPLIRLLASAAAATVAATGLLVPPAHALTSQPFFSTSDGWRTDRHVRVLGDVNGDDRDDVIGFGEEATYVALGRSDGTFDAPAPAVIDFSYAQGWRVDRHLRMVADVDGDGRDDLVGFGDSGVFVAFAQPNGIFTPAEQEVEGLGWDQGWRVEEHPRELVDLDSNGTADIVAFGYHGVTVAHGLGTDTFGPGTLQIRGLGYADGWRVDKHPRQFGDMDGDGWTDIVGFGDAGAWVAYYSGQADAFTTPQLQVEDFGYAQGWRTEHPRVLGDVDGDKKDDIVGFGEPGTLVGSAGPARSISTPSLELADFGAAQGWQYPLHLRTLADIDADDVSDIVGFGDAGVYASLGSSDFAAPTKVTGSFGADAGWGSEHNQRLLGDVNGDKKDDIVGFGYSAVHVELS